MDVANGWDRRIGMFRGENLDAVFAERRLGRVEALPRERQLGTGLV